MEGFMFTDDVSTNLKLPLLLSSQTQKHITYNEAVVSIDNLMMLSVVSRNIGVPPSNPQEGDRYLISSGSSGEWAGKSGQIAAYNNLGWKCYPPKSGFLCYVTAENLYLVHNGTNWINLPVSEGSLQNLPSIGIDTVADTNNPLSAKINNGLFTAKYVSEGGIGDVRLKLNKEAANKTASFIFQDNWSGRAEIGLTGDDNFHFKVSSDGTNWKDALMIDKSSGAVTPASLVHAPSSKPIYSYMPCTISDIYRIDETCGANPRTATISGVSVDTITLSTSVAYRFHTSNMSFSSVRVWNKSKTPIQSAWVMAATSGNTLKVTDAAHISGWSNGDTIQIGDDPLSGAPFSVITIDISRLLIEKFGISFRQSAIILNGVIVTSAVGDNIGYSPSGSVGSAMGMCQYGNTAPPGIFPCTDMSPISNSNLVRIIETFSGNSTIRLVRIGGVFA